MHNYDGSRMTKDHKVIRKWVEQHGGVPAEVKSRYAAQEEAGLIRIFFPNEESGDDLETVSWDDFFEKFDQAHLMFVFDEHTQKNGDRFFKFISLDGE